MERLLAGLVPGLPARAVASIVARADGVPLYAVETVRMLLSQGRLVLDGGAYRPVGDLDDVAVPETLTALIAARLDGLDPADRELVADAAVLGQSFSLPGLAAVSGVAEARARAPAARSSSAASCSSSTSIPGRPSAASTPSSRRSSARSPTTRSRAGTARSATSPRRATSRTWARTSSPAGSRATTSPRSGWPRTRPRPTRWRRRRGSRSGQPRSGRPRSARTSRR